MSEHCDIVEFSCLDAYMNNTLKAVSLLKYIEDGREVFGWNPDFVFLIDGNSWIKLDELWNRIYKGKEGEYVS